MLGCHVVLALPASFDEHTGRAVIVLPCRREIQGLALMAWPSRPLQKTLDRRATCKTAGSRRIFHSEREQIVASALASRMVFPQRITSRTGARTCLYARRYQTPGITFKDSFSRCCGKR